MRVVVAGFGSIGQRHAANLRQLHPDAEIGILRSGLGGRDDPVPAIANQQFFSVEAATEFAPLATIIATPAPFHVATARRFLEGGSHVLVEKPISDRLDGIAELEVAARERDLVAMVGYNLLFTPAMQAFGEAVRSGRAGRLVAVKADVGQYLPDWRPHEDYRRGTSARRELGGGVLLELSHELHYLLWLFGPVRTVQATIINSGLLEIDVEDLALLNLVFRSGVVASLHMDFLRRTYSRSCSVLGSIATLTWDARRQAVELTSPGAEAAEVLFSDARLDRNQAYLSELEHFFSCIRERRTPVVPVSDALQVLRVVLAARESASSGSTVYL